MEGVGDENNAAEAGLVWQNGGGVLKVLKGRDFPPSDLYNYPSRRLEKKVAIRIFDVVVEARFPLGERPPGTAAPSRRSRA